MTDLLEAEPIYDFGETSYLFSTASIYPPLYTPVSNQQAWGRDWVQPGNFVHQNACVKAYDPT